MPSWRTALWRLGSDHHNDVHFFSFSEYWCHRDGQRREGQDLIILMMYIYVHFQSTDAIMTDGVVKAGSDHVTWGPMRGLEKNHMGRGQTHTHTHRRTDFATTRPNRPRGPSWWKATFRICHSFIWLFHTILWLHQTMRPSCSSSMFNGIRLEPTNKRFNSAYLHSKYLISRKIQSNALWLDETFSCWSQVTMMFWKKKILENKKIEVRFSNVDAPAKPTKQKKTSSPWKIIEVTHSWKSGRSSRSGVIIIILKLFFFKIPDLVHRHTLAPVAVGNRR